MLILADISLTLLLGSLHLLGTNDTFIILMSTRNLAYLPQISISTAAYFARVGGGEKGPLCAAKDLSITYWNEVNTEDHDAGEEERRGLAEVPGAALEQYQGNYVSWHLSYSRQEAVYVRVSIQVWGVEDQSKVTDGDDEPAETFRTISVKHMRSGNTKC